MNDDGSFSPLKDRAPSLDEAKSSVSKLAVVDEKLDTPDGLKRNFWLFCIFYSIIHGAVDAVLAFSAAELGTNLGSLGGTVLYALYTTSALFLAKPCLQFFEAKLTVFLGLIGLLIYVSGFFLAILIPSAAPVFFLTGCGVGGIGAGLLWTGQGSYYTLNASYHAIASKMSRTETITKFAGIFAGTYLSFETCYKFIGTFVFIIVGISSSSAWQPALFGIYASSAFISTLFFWTNTRAFKDHPSLLISRSQYDDDHHDDATDVTERESQRRRLLSNENVPTTLGTSPVRPASSAKSRPLSHTYLEVPADKAAEDSPAVPLPWQTLAHNVGIDMLAVGKMICSVQKLQFMIPYQICFGLSAGLVDTYVNGVIVKTYIGEGYIGVLSGIVTLSAALLAAPFVVVGNTRQGRGKDWIMVLGGVCFALGGLMLLVFTDAQIAHWPIIITYYILHGMARGVWENTNKAVISEMFEYSPSTRDAAFATVYFSSGLAGALGFAFFQFLSKSMIALINLAISGTAILCFLLARKLHRRDMRVREVRQMVSALDDDSSHSQDDDNDEVEVFFSPMKKSVKPSPSMSANPLHHMQTTNMVVTSSALGEEGAAAEDIAYSRI